MSTRLEKLFLDHKGKLSDKWSLYIHEWDHLLEPYHERPVNILEIGTQNGGSLEIWAKYFRKAAHIIGCDINPQCGKLQFEDPRISIVIGDVTSKKCWQEIQRRSPAFDIIIDDGSHQSGDIIRTFAQYFPMLSEGGVYIVEDLHCSYWKDFAGGLNDPLSSISFFKRLIDVTNFEHWNTRRYRGEILEKFSQVYGIHMLESELARIHSVEFLNSLCIIRKAAPDENSLGLRRVTGRTEPVTEGFFDFDGQTGQDMFRDHSDPGGMDVFQLMEKLETSDQQSAHLGEQLAKKDVEIARLGDQVGALLQANKNVSTRLGSIQQELLAVVTSDSWKLTRPFRKIQKFIRGLLKHAK